MKWNGKETGLTAEQLIAVHQRDAEWVAAIEELMSKSNRNPYAHPWRLDGRELLKRMEVSK